MRNGQEKNMRTCVTQALAGPGVDERTTGEQNKHKMISDEVCRQKLNGQRNPQEKEILYQENYRHANKSIFLLHFPPIGHARHARNAC